MILGIGARLLASFVKNPRTVLSPTAVVRTYRKAHKAEIRVAKLKYRVNSPEMFFHRVTGRPTADYWQYAAELGIRQ
jgi:hypothetical protein